MAYHYHLNHLVRDELENTHNIPVYRKESPEKKIPREDMIAESTDRLIKKHLDAFLRLAK